MRACVRAALRHRGDLRRPQRRGRRRRARGLARSRSGWSKAGAQLTARRHRPEPSATLADELGARLDRADRAALLAEVDVLAPCALGGAIDETTVGAPARADRLRRGQQPAGPRRAGRRPGGARDPLRARLHRQRGRDHQHLGRARAGRLRRRRGARARVAAIEETMREMFDEAERDGVTPLAAAYALARRRLQAAENSLNAGRIAVFRRDERSVTCRAPREPRRPRRRHAAGAAHARGAGLRRRADRQARGLQPGGQRQGPDRRGDDRRRRGARGGSSRAAPRSSRPPPATPASRSRSSAPRAATSSCSTMPQGMSREREGLLRLYGARGGDHRVDGRDERGGRGRRADGRRARATRFIPDQFSNPANPEIHRRTTAEEIWRDTDGEVDVLVAGVGTGGTITGAGERLKERNPDLHVVAVEPKASPVLSGGRPGRTRSRASAPASCRRCSTATSSTRSSPVDDEDAIETGAARVAHARACSPASPAARRCGPRSRWAAGPSWRGKRIVVVHAGLRRALRVAALLPP